MHHVQNVKFPKSSFNKTQARAWLQDRGFKSTAVEEEKNTLDFPQMNKKNFYKFYDVQVVNEGTPPLVFVLGTK